MGLFFRYASDVDLDFISISSFEDEKAPPTTKSACKSSKSSSQEIHQYEQLPIYGDTTYNINKSTRLSWYHIYEEFPNPYIPETQENFSV